MSNISVGSSHVIGDVVLRLLLQLSVVFLAEMDLLQAFALQFEVRLADLLDVQGSLGGLIASRDVTDYLFRCVG